MERTILAVHLASFGPADRLMRALAALPDVERVEALGFERGLIRFALEHRDGVPLDQRLRERGLTISRVAGACGQLHIWVATGPSPSRVPESYG